MAEDTSSHEGTLQDTAEHNQGSSLRTISTDCQPKTENQDWILALANHHLGYMIQKTFSPDSVMNAVSKT